MTTSTLNAVLLVLAAFVCSVRCDFEPPIITQPNGKEVIVSVGGNLTLICKGLYPLNWLYPIVANLDGEFMPAESYISISPKTNSDPYYAVRLDMYNVSVIDVGYYTCHFNDSDTQRYAEDPHSPQLLEKQGKAARVYVYVEDPDNLMVPSDSAVEVVEYGTVTIPCRPSSPNVHVSLNRGPTQVMPNTPQPSLSNRIVTYDRREGFSIPTIRSFDTSAAYKCTYSRNGNEQSHLLLITMTLMTYSIAKPQINDSYNGNTELGGELKLDCFIKIERGILFDLKWIYPNININPSRVIITNATTQNINGVDNMYKIGRTTLTISNITKANEGPYVCEAVDGSSNFSNDTKLVKVLDQNSYYINISEPANLYAVDKMIFSYVKWALVLEAYPFPKIELYKNNNSISADGKKYILNVTVKQILIRINNLTLEDSGLYQVKASNIYKTSITNLTLTVLAPPVVKLESKKFYMEGMRASIACEIIGYPQPKVSWTFTQCNDFSNCEASKKINVPLENFTKETSGNKVRSIITLPINNSGFLTCNGKNNKGTHSQTTPIYVTDIDKGFGIIRNFDPVIAIGDTINITCAMSFHCNTSIGVYWMKGNTSLPAGQFQGIHITESQTKYSKQATLFIPRVSKSFSNIYTCKSTEPQMEDDVCKSEDIISLQIQDPKAPVIISNLTNAELRMNAGPSINYYCSASGIPTPTIKWYKDYKELKPDKRIEINSNGPCLQQKLECSHLTFSYTLPADDGYYECKAENRVRTQTKHITLVIANKEFKVVYISVIIALAIVFVILIIFLIYKIKKEKEIRKELSIAGLLHFEEGATESLNFELGIDEQAELLPYDRKWEFPREKLKLGKQLGSGAFGVVMKATAQGIISEEESTVVAVKMVKKTADPTFIKALASELKIMVHLGRHLNVVNLLGACTKNVAKRELLMIVEYCRFGNLHNYLLKHRDNFIDQIDQMTDAIDPTIGNEIINRTYSISSNKSGMTSTRESARSSCGPHSPGLDTAQTVISMVPNGDSDGLIVSNGSVQPEWRSNYKGDYNYSRDMRPISTQDLLGWSFQVARGMEYLANRKVLHGDLAARNILLADNHIVKICDFGLAKSMYKNDNYRKKGDALLPIKWMAIESIGDRIFSTQSDVWSFGVVLWEIFSLARTPYPGMQADEKFYNDLREGYRMEKPDYANKRIYQCMLECWRAKPIQRPTFSKLCENLGMLLEDNVRKLYIDLNDPYMDMNSRWLAERGENDYLAMMSAPDYGNLASPNHEYVNHPFGGPSTVNPLSPDDTDAQGYLCMSPAKNGVITKEIQVFDFSTPAHRKNKSSVMNEDDEAEPIELVPMLTVDNQPQRPASVSDQSEAETVSPTSPPSKHNAPPPSFYNPSYQPMLIIPQTPSDKKAPNELIIAKDNYVNMSQKDSGFCDGVDVENPLNEFLNPSYVQMNAKNPVAFKNMYANVPPSTVI